MVRVNPRTHAAGSPYQKPLFLVLFASNSYISVMLARHRLGGAISLSSAQCTLQLAETARIWYCVQNSPSKSSNVQHILYHLISAHMQGHISVVAWSAWTPLAFDVSASRRHATIPTAPQHCMSGLLAAISLKADLKCSMDRSTPLTCVVVAPSAHQIARGYPG
jgi:hypothetical protein